MVKARIPGSSQELYTVSVESVPQYAGGNHSGGKRLSGRCCRSGRVGKDLLCGVLIALAVICAAVAIFLVVFYVVNGTDENQLAATGNELTDQPNNSTQLADSSPLTRDREEDKKINSLINKDGHDWQFTGKDQLSLSSTSLPDVGIHEPELHVNGEDDVYSPYSRSTTGQQQVSSSTEQPEVQMDGQDDMTQPIVGEAKSQDGVNPTSLFVPDDDVIIETPSDNVQPIEPVASPSSTEATTTSSTSGSIDVTSPSPLPAVVAVSGFVPVPSNQDEEAEQQVTEDAQTESLAEVLTAIQNKDAGPAVDLAPWKPIQPDLPVAPVNNNRTEDSGIQGRFIVDESEKSVDQQSLSKDSDDTIIKTTTPKTSTEATSALPVNVTTSTTTVREPEESTDFALMQDLGNMALLVPEDRVRTSTSTVNPSSSTEQIDLAKAEVDSSSAAPQPQCIRRQLAFCRGILPYSETILPNWVGDTNESERNFSVPYFEIIAESECHARVQQYACAVLEPPCRGNGISLPPCRQFCRAIAEDCSSYVLSALKLATVLDCDQFPQSNDPNVCLNLASTTPEGECLPNEYRCSSDNTCIPERWVCDGQIDCSQGDDEFSCSRCRDDEFRCESENRCLPKRWRCDGSRDCADGSDERDCAINQECGDGQFRCGDGLSCIPLRRVCDGSNHCRDNSDETNCTAIACQLEDFKCRDNGVCISRKWVCDGNEDCKDASDEADCAREAELDFESDVLIEEMPLSEQPTLNGTSAVPDTTFNPEKCPLGELLCMSGSTCIRFEQLCDGTRDCADGADETDCSKSSGTASRR